MAGSSNHSRGKTRIYLLLFLYSIHRVIVVQATKAARENGEILAFPKEAGEGRAIAREIEAADGEH